tara:strand:+ start:3882 stop:4625 length:744 start_codon:yes stop_codon:yes gene_type:complete
MTALLRWTIRIHKWVALIVGIQIVLWVAGGVVMSVIPIETVRGEHNIAPPEAMNFDLPNLISVQAAAEAARPAGGLAGAQLEGWQGRPVWNITARSGSSVLVDALDGTVLTPINRERAIEIARADYAGDPEIAAVTYFEEPTWESRRPGPTWRIDFADGEGTRIYVSENSGLVVARRNDAWRFYDFFWMLHIMDYGERENFNNPLLITFSIFSLLTVFAGLLLLVMRIQRLFAMEIARREREKGLRP